MGGLGKFSYTPPVVVPFEDMHYQTFMQGMKTEGTFFGNRMATAGDDVKQLEYTIEYRFTPEKRYRGRKPNEPAMMSVHLRAKVTDLVAPIPDRTKQRLKSAQPTPTKNIQGEK